MTNPAPAAVVRGLCLALVAVLALPAASAWSLDRQALAPASAPSAAAWTTDLQPRAFPAGEVTGAVQSAAACALGDVTGDGVADIVVLASATAGAGGGAAGATTSLQALAGPGFTQVVWQKASDLQRVLRCAPDLDLDGTLDPILSTLGPVTSTANGAAGQTRQVVQQTLQGASGAALVGRADPAAITGAASGGLQAGQAAASALLPAAAGAAAYLQASASGATLPVPPLPVPLPLPVDSLTATARQAAQIQVLDVTGAVVSTVSIDEAGVDPLALAPVQLTGALPDVAVLSQSAISPVKEAAASVPELALYAADGTLAWSTQLTASTGVPILVPNAGDLDLDGVGDLIVTTVEQKVQAAPGAAYSVLSGVDGRVLFDSGPAVSGLVAALPLGQLAGGPALLEATQVDGASSLALKALDGAGNVLWSADVDALATPANLALDAYTGDVTGFTDLTGDAVPDVAVAVQSGTGLALKAIDGATGAVAWDLDVPDASEVVPVVIGAAQAVGNAAGAAGAGASASASASVARLPGLGGSTDGVQEAVAGASSSLLAIGHSSTNATLTLVDAATGAVAWTSVAQLPPGFDLGSLTAQVAGDLDGDQVQDLLVTAMANATMGGMSGAGARSEGAGQGAAAGDGQAPTASVAAVSGASGDTLWSDSTSAGAPDRLDFQGDVAPASAGESQPAKNGIPSPALPGLVAAVALAGLLARRRRTE
jgi:hypothetical protein